jgi:thiol-disulfide isomerase/thioredoxin
VNRRFAGLLLPLLLLAGACTRTASGPAATPVGSSAPFADCAALSRPPAKPAGPSAAGPSSAGPSSTDPSSTGTPAGGTDPAGNRGLVPAGAPTLLPDLRLPCFTGGDPVGLAAVRGPAVVNLWASWCPPCRKELPAFQRLAGRAGGQLHVVGVDTRDDRDAARSLAVDFGLTFPTLFDPDEQLRRKVARNALPITLFVDAEGRVRHIDNTGALDDSSLSALVERHLGVPAR